MEQLDLSLFFAFLANYFHDTVSFLTAHFAVCAYTNKHL